MKKIIAILLCAMLMLSCLAVVAESGIMPLTEKCDGGCSYRRVSRTNKWPNKCTLVTTTEYECTVCGDSYTDTEKVVNHVGDKIENRCSECGGKWS